MEDVRLGASADGPDDLLIIVDEEWHRATVPTRGLDVPLLSYLVALIKELGAFRGLADVDLRSQNMLDDNGGHILKHLLTIQLDLLIHTELAVPLDFHLLHIFLALGPGSLLGGGLLLLF